MQPCQYGTVHTLQGDQYGSVHAIQEGQYGSAHAFQEGQYGILALSFSPNFTHNFISKFTPVFIPSFNLNITSNLLHHDECKVIRLSGISKLSSLYSLCFVHSFLFCSKVVSLQFPANGTCRKSPTVICRGSVFQHPPPKKKTSASSFFFLLFLFVKPSI